MGSSSSPNTVESTSRPAAEHLRKFQRLTSSPSLSLPLSPCAWVLHRARRQAVSSHGQDADHAAQSKSSCHTAMTYTAI